MLFIIMCVLVAAACVYGSMNHDYWAKKGVKFVKPVPFFGNFLPVMLLRVSLTQSLTRIYRIHEDEKIVGCYIGHRPSLIVRDPEIVKAVTIADFVHFHNRGMINLQHDARSLLKNLLFADGDLWKLLRQGLSPAFSLSKLKAMSPIVVERTGELRDLAKKAAATGETVNMKDMIARYTTDFIGACGYGIDTKSLKDENSYFRKLGRRVFTVPFRDAIVLVLKLLFPKIAKSINILAPEIQNASLNIIQNVMQEREYKHSGRNDFVDFLLELKGKGNLAGESIVSKNLNASPRMLEIKLDDTLMAAQAFMFFVAGFETSSTATSYTLHELAFHPNIQKKVQKEIDAVLERYDNRLCYDAIKEMKYLEMVLLETMRLFPPVGYLIRNCTRKYTLPGTEVTIDEGVYILVPVEALHTDEQYYKDADKFVPERFNSENIHDIKKQSVYLPFGQGPRACIAERLGVMQSLMGLAALLHKFRVEPAPTTERHPIVDPTSNIAQNLKNGLPLLIRARR